MKSPAISLIAMGSLILAAAAGVSEDSARTWSLTKAVQVLNSSAWARQETFTKVIRGVGSGVSGEKEIFNTFYVRFLSAVPIRDAYRRIQQIQYGYDTLGDEERRKFDAVVHTAMDLDVDRWIVVTVGFRSNDPNEESTVRRFFQIETTETLKNRAFLSTARFSQVAVAAYFPPRDEGVGAKFVFPRDVDGTALVDKNSSRIVFELLRVPGANPNLRSTFEIREMIVDDVLIL